MNKTIIALTAALLLAPLAALHAADVPAKKPNVLLIVCDDLNGYIEGFGGHPQLKTPNLDKLAAQGTDFQQFNVLNPVCSPSCTAVMTGMYIEGTLLETIRRWPG